MLNYYREETAEEHLQDSVFGMKDKKSGLPIVEMINLDMRVKNERSFAYFSMSSVPVLKLVKNEKVKLSISRFFEIWLSYDINEYGNREKVVAKERVKCLN